jgi:hypothetical protein
VCCVFSLSSLFFVLTGIQFWISDYLRTVLDIPQQEVFVAFAVVSITGPTLGVLIGKALNFFLTYVSVFFREKSINLRWAHFESLRRVHWQAFFKYMSILRSNGVSYRDPDSFFLQLHFRHFDAVGHALLWGSFDACSYR